MIGIRDGFVIDAWLMFKPFWGPNSTRNLSRKEVETQCEGGCKQKGQGTADKRFCHHSTLDGRALRFVKGVLRGKGKFFPSSAFLLRDSAFSFFDACLAR